MEEEFERAQALLTRYEDELLDMLPADAEIFDAHVDLGHDIDGQIGVYEELERLNDMAVRLVHAEHEAPRDARHVVEPLQLLVDADLAVDVVAEMDVRVEDHRRPVGQHVREASSIVPRTCSRLRPLELLLHETFSLCRGQDRIASAVPDVLIFADTETLSPRCGTRCRSWFRIRSCTWRRNGTSITAVCTAFEVDADQGTAGDRGAGRARNTAYDELLAKRRSPRDAITLARQR